MNPDQALSVIEIMKKAMDALGILSQSVEANNKSLEILLSRIKEQEIRIQNLEGLILKKQ